MCATLMQRLRILRPDLRIFSIQVVPCQQRDLSAGGASTRTAIVRSETIWPKGRPPGKNRPDMWIFSIGRAKRVRAGRARLSFAYSLRL